LETGILLMHSEAEDKLGCMLLLPYFCLFTITTLVC
jgi:hypothetical protein